ncbi:MAG TPA: hypothetical protein VNK25_03250 [Candidatus Nitrosotenuis sp.]|jgi:hypothetical protein|nr:hypothetical protein [Candidatus Nitrosotenuis sp.]
MKLLIQWESIIIESTILATIIFGAVFVENWSYRRMQKKEDSATRKKILLLIKEDLIRKLRFIDDTIQYNDYKPFFTYVWDSTILSGKQTLLRFETIKNLDHTYSWMKYYNTELQQKGSVGNEQTLKELLAEIKKTTESSLNVLDQKSS